MSELITKVEKLEPHPTEAITLFYDFNVFDRNAISDTVDHLSELFPENTIIALPDNMSLENCSKDVLENIISMITMIIEKL